MKIGDLRHLVTVEAISESPDGGYSLTQSFSTVTTAWAKLQDVRGIVKFGAANIDTETTHICTMRYYPGIKADVHFIKHDGRRFRVRHVKDRWERTRFLELELQEAFDQGTYD